MLGNSPERYGLRETFPPGYIYVYYILLWFSTGSAMYGVTYIDRWFKSCEVLDELLLGWRLRWVRLSEQPPCEDDQLCRRGKRKTKWPDKRPESLPAPFSPAKAHTGCCWFLLGFLFTLEYKTKRSVSFFFFFFFLFSEILFSIQGADRRTSFRSWQPTGHDAESSVKQFTCEFISHLDSLQSDTHEYKNDF